MEHRGYVICKLEEIEITLSGTLTGKWPPMDILYDDFKCRFVILHEI